MFLLLTYCVHVSARTSKYFDCSVDSCKYKDGRLRERWNYGCCIGSNCNTGPYKTCMQCDKLGTTLSNGCPDGYTFAYTKDSLYNNGTNSNYDAPVSGLIKGARYRVSGGYSGYIPNPSYSWTMADPDCTVERGCKKTAITCVKKCENNDTSCEALFPGKNYSSSVTCPSGYKKISHSVDSGCKKYDRGTTTSGLAVGWWSSSIVTCYECCKLKTCADYADQGYEAKRSSTNNLNSTSKSFDDGCGGKLTCYQYCDKTETCTNVSHVGNLAYSLSPTCNTTNYKKETKNVTDSCGKSVSCGRCCEKCEAYGLKTSLSLTTPQEKAGYTLVTIPKTNSCGSSLSCKYACGPNEKKTCASYTDSVGNPYSDVRGGCSSALNQVEVVSDALDMGCGETKKCYSCITCGATCETGYTLSTDDPDGFASCGQETAPGSDLTATFLCDIKPAANTSSNPACSGVDALSNGAKCFKRFETCREIADVYPHRGQLTSTILEAMKGEYLTSDLTAYESTNLEGIFISQQFSDMPKADGTTTTGVPAGLVDESDESKGYSMCGVYVQVQPAWWQVLGGNVYARENIGNYVSLFNASAAPTVNYALDAGTCSASSDSSGLQMTGLDSISSLTRISEARTHRLSSTSAGAYGAFGAGGQRVTYNYDYFQEKLFASHPELATVSGEHEIDAASGERVFFATPSSLTSLRVSSLLPAGSSAIINDDDLLTVFVDGDLLVDAVIPYSARFRIFIVKGKVTFAADLGLDPKNPATPLLTCPQSDNTTNDDVQVRAMFIAERFEFEHDSASSSLSVINNKQPCDRQLIIGGSLIQWGDSATTKDLNASRTFTGCVAENDYRVGLAANPNETYPSLVVISQPQFLQNAPLWMKDAQKQRYEVR